MDVRGNPKFADLTPAFLANRRRDAAAILEALERGDFEIVTSLGHGMKGAGGSFGFQPITDIGAALEEAAGNEDDVLARKVLRELHSYLDGVEIVSA